MADDKAGERLSGALRTYKVYYLFDARTSALLYIGRSHAPNGRKWAFEKRFGTLTVMGPCQRFKNFERACDAEREAIKRHDPPWNVKAASTAGMSFKVHSASAKAVIGAAHRGKVQSPETRAKLRALAMGRPSGMKGRKLPDSAKATISRKAKARWEAKRAG